MMKVIVKVIERGFQKTGLNSFKGPGKIAAAWSLTPSPSYSLLWHL